MGFLILTNHRHRGPESNHLVPEFLSPRQKGVCWGWALRVWGVSSRVWHATAPEPHTCFPSTGRFMHIQSATQVGPGISLLKLASPCPKSLRQEQCMDISPQWLPDTPTPTSLNRLCSNSHWSFPALSLHSRLLSPCCWVVFHSFPCLRAFVWLAVPEALSIFPQ